jgi:acyl-CoA oxidase
MLIKLNMGFPQNVRYMPPTLPTGTPTIAIVFARLVVSGRFFGIRPFVVDLNDGNKMCPGVTAK